MALPPRILVVAYMNAMAVLTDQVETLCGKLRVLSVESRLRMLALLAERNLCVGALARHLRLTQGAVSQHLKVLREAGLVVAERSGYFVHYKVDEEAVAGVQQELDRMLERVRRGHASAGLDSQTSDARCRKGKESVCARREREAVAGRGAT